MMQREAQDQVVWQSELARALERRVSVRQFKTTPIARAKVEHWLALAQRSPTSSNLQTCSVIAVEEPERRRAIAECAGRQKHIVQAPVFLVFCADLSRIAALYNDEPSAFDARLDLELCAIIDAALMAMSYSLLAETEGYGSVMIGAVRNAPERIARLLGLPPYVFAVTGLCVGEIETKPAQKPRLPVSAILHNDRYDASASLSSIDAYDNAMTGYYAQRDDRDGLPWSVKTRQILAESPRREMAAALRRLGFYFR